MKMSRARSMALILIRTSNAVTVNIMMEITKMNMNFKKPT